MANNNYIGNISTVIKLMGMMFAGWIISIFAAQGLDLGVDASALGEVIGVLLGLGFGYIDAKYPNTFAFLNNEDNTQPITDDTQPITDDTQSIIEDAQPTIDNEQDTVDYGDDEYV